MGAGATNYGAQFGILNACVIFHIFLGDSAEPRLVVLVARPEEDELYLLKEVRSRRAALAVWVMGPRAAKINSGKLCWPRSLLMETGVRSIWFVPSHDPSLVLCRVVVVASPRIAFLCYDDGRKWFPPTVLCS